MPSDAAPFAFGDVVLIAFPFTDQTATKRRPAVVVSSQAYNLAKPDLILMPVTSQLRSEAALGDVWLEDWRAAGLLKPSAVKPVVATLEQSLVLRRLGALSDHAQDALRSAIHKIIG